MVDASPEPLMISVSRRFAASAEQVFAAWLDPLNIGKWLFKTPTGEMDRVEVDPRVGGSFAIVEKRGDVLAEHFGTYVTIEAPRRLVFSFTTNRESNPTLVTIEITPVAGGCQLVLSHKLEPKWASFVDQARSGWTMILENLDMSLES